MLKEIIWCGEIEYINGKPNGTAFLDEQLYPVINNKIITHINFKKIENCKEVFNINNKLNGAVKIGESWLPVIDGNLITHINRQEIKYCWDVRNVNGKLNCKIIIMNGNYGKVINGHVITFSECRVPPAQNVGWIG